MAFMTAIFFLMLRRNGRVLLSRNYRYTDKITEPMLISKSTADRMRGVPADIDTCFRLPQVHRALPGWN
jgi:hypothetical protein